MDFKKKADARTRYSRPDEEEQVDDVEEGEIKFDRANDDELDGFRKWDSSLIDSEFILENNRVDESFMHDFEILQVLKGDFDPLQLYLDKLAYKNLDYKLAAHKQSQDIAKLIKI